MLRRAQFIANNLYYDESFVHAEDYELWLRASRCLRVANIPEILLDYRISPTQISSVHRQIQWETAARVREQQLNQLGIFPDNDERKVFDSIVQDAFGNSVQYLAAAGRFLEKVFAANRASHIYLESYLIKNLENMWFAVCCSACRAGNCSYATYINHPVMAGFAGVDKMKYTAKWFWSRKGQPSIYK
jgi:hypothetical protein